MCNSFLEDLVQGELSWLSSRILLAVRPHRDFPKGGLTLGSIDDCLASCACLEVQGIYKLLVSVLKVPQKLPTLWPHIPNMARVSSGDDAPCVTGTFGKFQGYAVAIGLEREVVAGGSYKVYVRLVLARDI